MKPVVCGPKPERLFALSSWQCHFYQCHIKHVQASILSYEVRCAQVLVLAPSSPFILSCEKEKAPGTLLVREHFQGLQGTGSSRTLHYTHILSKR